MNCEREVVVKLYALNLERMKSKALDRSSTAEVVVGE